MTDLIERVRAMQLRGNTPPYEVAHLKDDIIAALSAAPKPDTRTSGWEMPPTHYCNVCLALWRDNGDSWSLASRECGPCCDNVPMGGQIIAFQSGNRVAAPKPDELSQVVIHEIAAERKRQIEAEGWTPEHDDEHELGEMAEAAACYASGVSDHWPWDASWWKPKDKRRDLIRAAALIVAEIERLDRERVKKEGAL